MRRHRLTWAAALCALRAVRVGGSPQRRNDPRIVSPVDRISMARIRSTQSIRTHDAALKRIGNLSARSGVCGAARATSVALPKSDATKPSWAALSVPIRPKNDVKIA
jgi:hypothetical protein